MDISNIIKGFVDYAQKIDLEIYNEFSLQFELAIYLRKLLGEAYKIQLERNISFLGLKGNFLKKEIDIILFKEPLRLNESIVIELKAVINQSHARPITVFNWITDLKFLEQLKSVGVSQCYSFFVTDNSKLLSGPNDQKTKLNLLPDFRKRIIQGAYSTHSISHNKKSISLDSVYEFCWKSFVGNQQYFLLNI